jgi:hypothetical protein
MSRCTKIRYEAVSIRVSGLKTAKLLWSKIDDVNLAVV